MNTSTIRFKPKKDISDLCYLRHWIDGPEFREQISRLVTGSAQQNFGPSHLRSIQITLPSLSEQRRIAAILDKADALRLKRKQSLDVVDGLTQSIFLEMFGDPVTNPRAMPSRPLGDVATFVSGGTPNKSIEAYWNGNIPWVSPKDMKVTEIYDAEDHVSQEALSETSLKSISPESVLLVVRGMILSHTVPIALTRTFTTINQDMKAIQFGSTVNPIVGLWCLKVQHDHILTKVSSAAHGTKRLDMNDVTRLPILLPTTKEQELFVTAAADAARTRKRATRSGHAVRPTDP